MQMCNVSIPGTTVGDGALPSLPNKTLICLVNTSLGGKVVASTVIKTELSHEAPGFGEMVNEIVRLTPGLNGHEGMTVIYIPLPDNEEESMAKEVGGRCA